MEAIRAAYAEKRDSVSTHLKLHLKQMITEGTRILWKESAHRLRTTFFFSLNRLMNPVPSPVLLKCVIRFPVSFRWYAFSNVCTQISRPLACGVRTSSKASATAGAHPDFYDSRKVSGLYCRQNACNVMAEESRWGNSFSVSSPSFLFRTFSAVALTQISAYSTHKYLAVRKIMEAVRTAYAKKKNGTQSRHVPNKTWRKWSRNMREYVQGKRAPFPLVRIFEKFVRKFVVHLRTVYASSQKLAQPLHYTVIRRAWWDFEEIYIARTVADKKHPSLKKPQRNQLLMTWKLKKLNNHRTFHARPWSSYYPLAMWVRGTYGEERVNKTGCNWS